MSFYIERDEKEIVERQIKKQHIVSISPANRSVTAPARGGRAARGPDRGLRIPRAESLRERRRVWPSAGGAAGSVQRVNCLI